MSIISAFTSQQQRALDLLSSGVTPEQCSSALGISVSAISQYCSEEQFAGELAKLRFESLRKHNARDSELDSLEDTLIAQLKRLAPLALRPMEAARLFSIVNAAKRRGQSAPASITEQQTVIRLTVPIQIINRFQVDTNNQVISADFSATKQQLVTIQSSQMNKLALANDSKSTQLLSTNADEKLPDFGFS